MENLKAADSFERMLFYISIARQGDEEAIAILYYFIEELEKTKKRGSMALADFIRSQLVVN